MQSMTSTGSSEEVAYPFHSCLANAVILSSGAVVVTGGRGSEKEVWMSSVSTQWTRKKNMPVGRKGHAAAAVKVGGVESVIVPGGWDKHGKELARVSMFMPYKDKFM